MIVVRLAHWVRRTPVIPLLDSPGKKRPPTFWEAVFGIY